MSIRNNLRLSLFAGANYTGRNIVFRNGGVAVKNLGALRFNNLLTSFKVNNTTLPQNVTLVLFSRNNFKGSFRIFTGRTNVANLSRFNFNNVTSSFILTDSRLTENQVLEIQRTSVIPCEVVVITRQTSTTCS